MDNLRTSNCNRCKAMIVFITTQTGKFMPCDINPVMYREDPNGDKKIYTRTGKLVRCTLDCDNEDYTGFGYKPHWGSCISSEGRKRLEAYEHQVKHVSLPPPAVPPKPKPKPAVEESKFEQLCLFGNNERRSRHPM